MQQGKEIEGIRFPQLENLEKERIALLKFSTRLAIGLCVAFIFLLGALGGGHYLFTIFIIGLMAYLIKRLMENKNAFVAHFKSNVINSIVQHFNLSYSPTSGLSKLDFDHIYDVSCESWRSEDLIYGELDGIKLEIADMNVRNIGKHSKIKIKQMLLKEFSGILLKATFPKELTHDVYVCDKDDFGVRRAGEKALMDNNEFNRYFEVFSDDQIMARYALSPLLMETLCILKRKFNCSISLVFQRQEMRMAINLKIDSFEPNAQRSLLEDETIRNYIVGVKSFVDIVKDLGLNRTIWKS